MKRIRVIPTLLIQKTGLVKSVKFKNFTYVGDPINAVKIFNEKEVDEIVVLDISCTKEGREPSLSQIIEIASEAFIPMAYGGGIKTLDQIKSLIKGGIEKVVINSAFHERPELIKQASESIGSQSVVVSIDVKKNLIGKSRVFIKNGTVNTGIDPVTYAQKAEAFGAGELILMSIDKDGTFDGYDQELIRKVSNAVSIPVVASGGAGEIGDFLSAVKNGASAVTAGSMFVLQRPHKAVLISYPSPSELEEKLFNLI